MNLSKYFFGCLLVISIFFGFGCSQNIVLPTDPNTPTNTQSLNHSITPITLLDKTVYTAFIINVHDWTDPEKSIATINKIIDLHEKYQIPVDIYLDDQVTQIYALQAPELIDRLKTSSYVAVSYHLRPPYPYYWDYDWLGLDKMSDSELKTTLLDYEEHKIDLTTGQPTDEPGGYQYLKDLIGYPPYNVVVMGSPKVMPILAEVYKEKGAVLNLTHSGTTDWGENRFGLWMRPETSAIKVYEPRGKKSGEDIITDAMVDLTTDRPAFMNLKWHEDNFYTSGTPWGPVYWTNSEDRGTLSPPFDLSQAMVGVKVKTQAEQDEQWTRYEECLSYVKDHPEIFTAINAKNLTTVFGGE